MPELSPIEKQRKAFALLRDQARSAHLIGDGLKVGYFCEVALQEIDRLLPSQLLLSLSDIQWIFIFQYYWLLNNFTLTATIGILDKVRKLPAVDSELGELLSCYAKLIGSIPGGAEPWIDRMSKISGSVFGEEENPESLEAVTHICECAWFHSADSGKWEAILDSWKTSIPKWGAKLLDEVRVRLALQTRLTMPSVSHPPLSSTSDPRLRDQTVFARMWLLHLLVEPDEIGRIGDELAPHVTTDSFEWRLLADFGHINFFRPGGSIQDSQHVSLARRRSVSTGQPALNFSDQRYHTITRRLNELYNKRSSGSVAQEILQLASLHELSALRNWDIGMWFNAVGAQSEALLISCEGWSEAIAGLISGVRSISLEIGKNEGLGINAVRQLEFAPRDALLGCGRDLLSTYPRQWYRTQELLCHISDLIPDVLWEELARWTVRFAETTRAKAFTSGMGWKANPLDFWAEILPGVSAESHLWGTLQPEVLRLAQVKHYWNRGDAGAILLRWLVWAPLGGADAIADQIIRSPATEQSERLNRAFLLTEAEEFRGTTAKGRWTSGLIASATDPIEKLVLFEHLDRAKEAPKEEVRAAITASIERAIEAATPPSGSKSFSFPVFPPEVNAYSSWKSDDIALVTELVAAIDSPNLISAAIADLIIVLQNIVANGPATFSAAVLPHVKRWLGKPPAGGHANVQFHLFGVSPEERDAAVLRALGWLAFQLPRQIGADGDEVLLRWLTLATGSTKISSFSLAVYCCVILSCRSLGSQRSILLSTARAIVLGLSIKEGDQASEGAIAEALHFCANAMSKRESSLVNWETPDGAEALKMWIDFFDEQLPRLGRSASPAIRGHVAFLIWSLSQWRNLDAVLMETLSLLRDDTRARVRLSAKGGWRLAASS